MPYWRARRLQGHKDTPAMTTATAPGNTGRRISGKNSQLFTSHNTSAKRVETKRAARHGPFTTAACLFASESICLCVCVPVCGYVCVSVCPSLLATDQETRSVERSIPPLEPVDAPDHLDVHQRTHGTPTHLAPVLPVDGFRGGLP